MSKGKAARELISKFPKVFSKAGREELKYERGFKKLLKAEEKAARTAQKASHAEQMSKAEKLGRGIRKGSRFAAKSTLIGGAASLLGKSGDIFDAAFNGDANKSLKDPSSQYDATYEQKLLDEEKRKETARKKSLNSKRLTDLNTSKSRIRSLEEGKYNLQNDHKTLLSDNTDLRKSLQEIETEIQDLESRRRSISEYLLLDISDSGSSQEESNPDKEDRENRKILEVNNLSTKTKKELKDELREIVQNLKLLYSRRTVLVNEIEEDEEKLKNLEQKISDIDEELNDEQDNKNKLENYDDDDSRFSIVGIPQRIKTATDKVEGVLGKILTGIFALPLIIEGVEMIVKEGFGETWASLEDKFLSLPQRIGQLFSASKDEDKIEEEKKSEEGRKRLQEQAKQGKKDAAVTTGITAGSAVLSGGAKMASKKIAAKQAGKTAAKFTGKSLAKKLPFGAGAVIGTAFAAERLAEGDRLGAALEMASGIASTVPLYGTAVSLALDGVLGIRDWLAADKLEKEAEKTEKEEKEKVAAKELEEKHEAKLDRINQQITGGLSKESGLLKKEFAKAMEAKDMRTLDPEKYFKLTLDDLKMDEDFRKMREDYQKALITGDTHGLSVDNWTKLIDYDKSSAQGKLKTLGFLGIPKILNEITYLTQFETEDFDKYKERLFEAPFAGLVFRLPYMKSILSSNDKEAVLQGYLAAVKIILDECYPGLGAVIVFDNGYYKNGTVFNEGSNDLPDEVLETENKFSKLNEKTLKEIKEAIINRLRVGVPKEARDIKDSSVKVKTEYRNDTSQGRPGPWAASATMPINVGEKYDYKKYNVDNYTDSNSQDFENVNKNLISPVPKAWVTSGMDPNRVINGKKSPHYGIDLAASSGDPVRAMVSGTVVYTKIGDYTGKMVNTKDRHTSNKRGFRNTSYMTIETFDSKGNKVYHDYMHVYPLESIKVGSKVSVGQPIAKVTETDYVSTGPHLHFQMRTGPTYYPQGKGRDHYLPPEMVNNPNIFWTKGVDKIEAERVASEAPKSHGTFLFNNGVDGVMIDRVTGKAKIDPGYIKKDSVKDPLSDVEVAGKGGPIIEPERKSERTEASTNIKTDNKEVDPNEILMNNFKRLEGELKVVAQLQQVSIKQVSDLMSMQLPQPQKPTPKSTRVIPMNPNRTRSNNIS